MNAKEWEKHQLDIRTENLQKGEGKLAKMGENIIHFTLNKDPKFNEVVANALTEMQYGWDKHLTNLWFMLGTTAKVKRNVPTAEGVRPVKGVHFQFNLWTPFTVLKMPLMNMNFLHPIEDAYREGFPNLIYASVAELFKGIIVFKQLEIDMEEAKKKKKGKGLILPGGPPIKA